MKTPCFEYKGYYGSAEYSFEDKLLYGKLLFIRDLISYSAISARDIESNFRHAVDSYLESCAEGGREPNRPYSGTFNIHIGQDLHMLAAIKAELGGLSLNDFVREAVAEKVARDKKPLAKTRHVKKEAAAAKKITQPLKSKPEASIK